MSSEIITYANLNNRRLASIMWALNDGHHKLVSIVTDIEGTILSIQCSVPKQYAELHND